LVLVLDDLTEITDASVLDGLALLVRYRPARLRLVLVSRRDPPLPLARIRVSGELSEIRARDLAFTLEEANRLFDPGIIPVTSDDVEALWRRTEGWVAALRLAVLSLRATDDPHGFVTAFEGSDRTVADYLVAEVLEQLPEELRGFLLRTSIVRELDGSLASALTGRPDASAVLDELERWSGFVVRLGSATSSSYRYHQLLADLLRLEARARLADELPELHRRAARWYADEGDVASAIAHASEGGDWPLVAQLLADEWFTLFLEGETGRLRGYLDQLPRSVAARDPELAVAIAGNRLTLGDLEGAETYLQLAESNESLVPAPRRTRFAEGMTIVMLHRARLTGDPDQAVLAAREVLGTSTRTTPSDLARDEDRRALALSHLGTAELWSGDLDAAGIHLQDGLTIARRSGRDLLVLDCLSSLALLKAIRGELHEADELATAATDLARRRGWVRLPQVAGAHLARALVHYHWNASAEAAAELEAADEACEAGWEPPMRMGMNLIRAMVRAGEGAVGEARSLVRTARMQMGGWRPTRFLETILALVQIKLSVVDGETHAARSLLASAATLEPRPPEVGVEHARLALVEGDPSAAVEFLDRELIAGREDIHPVTFVDASLLEAVARERRGEHEAARRSLGRALAFAEGEGYWRVFIEHGAPVRELLRQEVRVGSQHRAFASDLLDSFEATPDSARATSRVLIEPLSNREQAVLRYLPTMLTNQEIAAETHVSVNTVKTHVKNIYRKLEVRGRRDAVKRARRLHLI
jgi:LuxR family maltose regulon positive regulatory protein